MEEEYDDNHQERHSVIMDMPNTDLKSRFDPYRTYSEEIKQPSTNNK